jgi:hypothetical protein
LFPGQSAHVLLHKKLVCLDLGSVYFVRGAGKKEDEHD